MNLEFWKPKITANVSNVVYEPMGHLLMTVKARGDLNFTVEADGGYWDLTVPFEDTEADVDEWLGDGLGRTVVLRDRSIIWMGFVNQVEVPMGNLNLVHGPLTDICNRCTVNYTWQPEVEGEIVSTQMDTVTDDEDTSKLKYGVWEKQLSAGTTQDETEAESVRNAYLAESAWPETSKMWSSTGGGTGVRLSCRGFVEFMKNWIVTRATAETDNVSVPIYDIATNPTDSKMLVVLNQDPNGLLDNTHARWDFDTIGVDMWLWEDQSTDAWSLIRNMVERGDGAGNRCVLGVYGDDNGLIVRYGTIPTDLSYQQALRDPAQRVKEYQGSELDYWRVLPNKWLMFTDFLVGRALNWPPNPDPRTMYIERVAFVTPNGLKLDGGKVHTVKQRLADFGLSL